MTLVERIIRAARIEINVTLFISVACSGDLQTFFLQALDPDHFNSSIFQTLRTLAFDEIIRFSDTDKASSKPGSHYGIGTGRQHKDMLRPGRDGRLLRVGAAIASSLRLERA